MDISIGKNFLNHKAMEAYIHEYQLKTNKRLKKENARCLKASEDTKGLKYHSVMYKCIAYGDFQGRGKGIRQYHSKKCGCPVFIKIGHKNKEFLEIKSFVLKPNDECNQNNFINFGKYYISITYTAKYKSISSCKKWPRIPLSIFS